jgi:hypothetical protein
LGTQLIRRNDELALLYEKLKIQQATLGKGQLAYRDRCVRTRTAAGCCQLPGRAAGQHPLRERGHAASVHCLKTQQQLLPPPLLAHMHTDPPRLLQQQHPAGFLLTGWQRFAC